MRIFGTFFAIIFSISTICLSKINLAVHSQYQLCFWKITVSVIRLCQNISQGFTTHFQVEPWSRHWNNIYLKPLLTLGKKKWHSDILDALSKRKNAFFQSSTITELNIMTNKVTRISVFTLAYFYWAHAKACNTRKNLKSPRHVGVPFQTKEIVRGFMESNFFITQHLINRFKIAACFTR